MNDDLMGVKGTPASVPFVQAPNAMFRDNRLSSDARLFLAYVASFDQGWRFFAPTVRQECGWAAEKLRKVMAECEAIGALRADRLRRPDGTLGGYCLTVTWAPWAAQIAAETLENMRGAPAHPSSFFSNR